MIRIMICDKVIALTVFVHVILSHCCIHSLVCFTGLCTLSFSLFFLKYCFTSYICTCSHQSSNVHLSTHGHLSRVLAFVGESLCVMIIILIHHVNHEIHYLKQPQDDAIDLAEEHSKTGHLETVNCIGAGQLHTVNWRRTSSVSSAWRLVTASASWNGSQKGWPTMSMPHQIAMTLRNSIVEFWHDRFLGAPAAILPLRSPSNLNVGPSQGKTCTSSSKYFALAQVFGSLGGTPRKSWEIFHSDICCSAKIKQLGQDGRALADAWYSTDGSAWSQAGSLGFGFANLEISRWHRHLFLPNILGNHWAYIRITRASRVKARISNNPCIAMYNWRIDVGFSIPWATCLERGGSCRSLGTATWGDGCQSLCKSISAGTRWR